MQPIRRFPGFTEDPSPAPVPPSSRQRRAPPPREDRVRTLLYKLLADRGVTMKDLSLAIGRGETYIAQYMAGRPVELPEEAREALAQFFRLDNPSVFRADPQLFADRAVAGYVYRLNLAAAGGGEVPEAERFLYPRPPFAKVPRSGTLALVTDGHADRIHPAGTVVWLADPVDLGRSLRAGDRVSVQVRADGSHRLMLVSLSADGHDILLQSATKDRRAHLVVALPRSEPAGLPDGGITYSADDGDDAIITGVVVRYIPPDA